MSPKAGEKKVESFLDPKRKQNMSIMLKQFKIPVQELLEHIKCLDFSQLTAPQVASLIKFIPTPEEMRYNLLLMIGF